MPTTFFSTQWDQTDTGVPAPSGPIARLSNAEVGVFYETLNAIDRPLSDTSEFTWKALPLIHEATLAKRPYGFCEERDKATIGAMEILDGKITPITMAELPNDFPSRISGRIDRILLNFYRANPEYGAPIEKLSDLDFFSHQSAESGFFFNLMKNQGLLEGRDPTRVSGGGVIFSLPIYIGSAGWQRIEDMERVSSSQQAFVAMSFDPSMDRIYAKIDSAVRSVGFTPRNIGLKEHNNNIVDEIQYEIRQSRFVIADVTGQKTGVFWEAGYAMGLGIPVIWSCRKDEIGKVHFDTNHYSHVVWEKEDDLFTKLVNRIKGTILT
jgi:nucleoside 2-deoxyribosyltransferase